MKFKNIHGFSLMEMMVVLLIIAVVMAATAPMITRKMISATDSPWVWVGNSGSIGYNLGNANVTASIGTQSGAINPPRLLVSSNTPDTHPQIRINSPNSGTPTSIDMSYHSKSIFISNSMNSNASESVAIGQGSTLGAKSTLALGTYAGASGQGSIAIGSGSSTASNGGGNTPNSEPKGGNSDPKGGSTPATQLTSRTLASQANAIAIGFDATAKSANSIAIGAKSAANGTLPMALGYNATSTGDLSTALGHSAIANKNYSIAIGSGNSDTYTQPAKATASYGIAIGVNSTASGSGGVAVGYNSTASDADASAYGMKAKATGDSSTAIGYSTKASGYVATALGQGANASGEVSLAIGGADGSYEPAKASNKGAIAIGTNSSSSGNYATALGYGATASGAGATAIGIASNASCTGATAIGRTAKATGSNYSTALGYGANASNNYALAIGINSNATEGYSIATGVASNASGGQSLAIGYNSNSAGGYSIAIGRGAKATGTMSIAIGTTVSSSGGGGGDGFFPGGNSWSVTTKATHSNSTAIGAGAQTSYANQIVLGDANTTVYIPGNLLVAKNIAKRTSVHGSYAYYNTVSLSGSHTLEGNFYSSDRRLKNVGNVYKGGLEELKKLDFFHYTFKNDINKTPRVGVMAQDLQKVFPDAVIKGEDGFLMIRWEDMFYAVINAVKELDQRLTTLSEQVKVNVASTVNLQERVAVLEKEITELKKQNEFFVKQNAELEKRLTRLEKHCQ